MNHLLVLLVEDDQDQAKLIGAFIKERQEAHITVSGTFSGARECLKTNTFDLVILDYRLPDGSGLELLQEITSVEDHPPVIIVTGQGGERTVVEAFRLGAAGYVIKGLDMSAILSEALDKAIRAIALRKKVHELEVVEKSLRESEELCTSVVDTSPAGITMSDLEGNIVMASHATVELHGFENEEEMLGMNAFDLIALEDRERAVENTSYTLKTGVLKHEEYTLLRKDGSTFPGSLTAGLMKDKDGNPEAFISITIDITEKKKADNEIQQLSRRLIKEQEEARSKLVADLHDEISQSLSVLKMYVSRIQSRNIAETEEIDQANAVLDNTMNTVRSICYELRPPGLETLGIEAALRDYLADYSRKTEIAVDFKCVGAFDISEDVAIQLFRVVQESLKNVEKHAQTDSASVTLSTVDDNILLQVQDHGKGFELSKKDKLKFGLWAMRERMLMVDGELAVDSSVGEGTLIRATVPTRGSS